MTESLGSTPPPASRGRFRFEVFYNWPGLLGVALIAVNGAVALAVFVADLWIRVEYVGVVYALLLLGSLLGAAIAGAGGLLGLRRRRLGRPSRLLEPWTLDLMRSRDRRYALAGLVTFVALFGFFASATGQGMRYLESREFCTEACHSVMEPEGTAARFSPHAELTCAECHVGSGAVHFAQAKLNGMRQLWGVVAGDYERPIPLPVTDMLPAEELCEGCHSRNRWIGYKEKQYVYFEGDDDNSPHPLRMLMKVGGLHSASGRGEGIHYHMLLDRKVEFVASDSKKSEVLWVRVTGADGQTQVFRRGAEGSDQAIAGKPVVEMSCLDCHSRPAHQFRAPTALMNELLASEVIDRSLPSVKVEGVALLSESHPDRATATETIEERMRERYEGEDGRSPGDPKLTAAIAAIQQAWSRNTFPSMRVSWQTYPNHSGHLDSPGCFRCHNDELTSDDGSTIFTDCTGCHVILAQGNGEPTDPVDFEKGVPFYHFTDDDTFEQYEECSSCHNGGSDIY